MGESSPANDWACRLEIMTRRHSEDLEMRRRLFNWRRIFAPLFRMLCLLCVLAEISSAQNQIDWSAQSEVFSQIIAGGTIEQKRDALLRIRNLEITQASRLAIPALGDKSEIVRATAASSVVFLPPNEAAPILIPLLADKKPFVRREAAFALGTVGSPSAIVPLLRVLQTDKVAEVRNAAIGALGLIGDVSAVPELVKLLRRRPQAKEEFARRSAARSIGRIAQILQTGKVTVITPENFLSERYKPIKTPPFGLSAETLRQLRSATGVLAEALQNPKEFPDVKREAAFALGAVGDESAIPILQANTAAEDYYLAEICRESLRKIQVAKR